MPKGIKGFQKGHRHSEETKRKIGLANSRSISFKCDYCGKKSKTKSSAYARKNRHFCSTKCYSNYRIEFGQPSEHPRWRGGITRETQRGRGNKKYKMWQTMVFERDGYKCIWCSSKEQIEADHIKRWSEHPELRYNVDNGRTLCIKCHNKIRNENPELME